MTIRRRVASNLFLILGFAMAPPAIAQDPAPNSPTQDVVLRGRVTNKSGNAPMAEVRVRLAVPATDLRSENTLKDYRVVEARTDTQGLYRIKLQGIAGASKVSIDALMPGYRRPVNSLVGQSNARNVEVSPGKDVEVDLQLEAARYFSGIVQDEKGDPISRVTVTGLIMKFEQDTSLIERTVTGPDGSFELFNFPAETIANGNLDRKGYITFEHSDYVEARVGDIDAIVPGSRKSLRIVLPTGQMVAGTVFDRFGKSVANAVVVVSPVLLKRPAPGEGTRRKSTVTDPEGKFILQGLNPGPIRLVAHSLTLQQRAETKILLDANELGQEVRMQPTARPSNLKTLAVLGIQLVDMTQELRIAYDLAQSQGVLILNPGPNTLRLNLGDIAEGDIFCNVGPARVVSVLELVNGLLDEVRGRDDAEYSIPVAYYHKTTDLTTIKSQSLKLTREDVKQLQAIADKLAADPK